MTASSVRGLNLLSAIEKYVAAKPNQWDTRTVLNKLKFHSASEGRLKATFTVEGWMCNSLNYLHGGYMASMVDVVSLFGLMSHDKGKLAWTSSINVVYPRAAFQGDEITVETVPLHVGATSLMEVVLKNQAGMDIAKATAVFQGGNEKLIVEVATTTTRLDVDIMSKFPFISQWAEFTKISRELNLLP